MFKQDYKCLFKKCSSCNDPEHFLEECPFLHFIPNRDLIIRKHLYYQPSSRKPNYKRKNRLKCKTNALKSFGKLQSMFEKENPNKLQAMYFLQENKKSYMSSSVEDEDFSFAEGEDNEKENSQGKNSWVAGEIIEKEEEKDISEREKEGFSQDYKITFVSEKTHNTQKEEFEKMFIDDFNLKRRLILNLGNNEKVGSNLFDFSFEKEQYFRFYFNNGNFDNVLRHFKKMMKRKKKNSQTREVERSKSNFN